MDITKRFSRILNLYFYLQSKSSTTLEELTYRFDVSSRTIYRDLKSLEEVGIPIINEPGCGYAIMEGFRMQPSRFTQEEIISLMIAEKMMQNQEIKYIKQHFDTALIKIKSSFRFHLRNDFFQMENHLMYKESYRENNYLPNVIDTLLNAVLKKKTAELDYKKEKDSKAIKREIEPVGIYYENSYWYVLAYCWLRKEYRNFRLDRIQKIVLTEKDFSIFHLSINELRQNNIQKTATPIAVKIGKEHAHHLYWDRDFFGFEKEKTDKNYIKMYFKCTQNPIHFMRWFMMFADIGDITEPIELQKELSKILQSAVDKRKKELK